MIKQIAMTLFLGKPLIMWGGLFTFLLFFLAAGVGYLTFHGKIKLSVNTHINLARIALLFGLIHAVIGILLFMNV